MNINIIREIIVEISEFKEVWCENIFKKLC